MYSRPVKAFTLIEVLVVVAIIALLVAILAALAQQGQRSDPHNSARRTWTRCTRDTLYSGQDQRSISPIRTGGCGWKSRGNGQLVPESVREVRRNAPLDSSRWVEFGHIYKYIKNKDA
jgi:prepilin-type N-terminal cleavage/methylation domain-containing protein